MIPLVVMVLNALLQLIHDVVTDSVNETGESSCTLEVAEWFVNLCSR